MTARHLADVVVPPPPRSGVDFPVLDTLRAVGALCVLTTHAMFWAGEYTRHGARGTLFARLDVGVAIFFVLSGFLLSRPWLVAAIHSDPKPRLGRYARKRILRIMPLYVVTVVLALVLIDQNSGLRAADWLSALLMLDTVTDTTFPAGLTQMWSLAAEVMFYIALPFLMVVLLGRKPHFSPWRFWIGFGALVATNIWWLVDGAARVGGVVDGATLQWLPAYLVWFGLGIVLALLHTSHSAGRGTRLSRGLARLARQPGACWVGAGALLLIAATPVAGPTMFAAPSGAELVTKQLLYAGIGFLVVLTGVFAVPGGLYERVMSLRLLRRMGWISYGMFCLHLPVLHFVLWLTGWELFREGHALAIWVLCLLLTVVAAELGYRFVERPALMLGARRRRGSSAAIAATTETSGTTIR